MTNEVFLIVDGGSTGKFYAPAFRACGFECVHIQSAIDMAPIFELTFCRQDYVENIIVNDDIESAVSQLAKYRILGIVTGSDSGLEIADTLVSRLAIPFANNLDGSSARRDKFLMHEMLAKHGMNRIRQARVRSVEDALAAIESRIGFPVVIKPVQSAGTDHVKICSTREQVEASITAILERPNIFRRVNDAAVVQEYIGGQEYMVDVVSFDGITKPIAIWKVDRSNGPSPFPLCATMIGQSETTALLTRYAVDVATALNHRWGAAHIEIKIKNNRPVLIELNARLHGRMDPGLFIKAIGASQSELVMKTLVDPRIFDDLPSDLSGLRGHAMKVYLVSPISGTVTHEPDFAPVRALDSFHSVTSKLHIGQKVQLTESLVTTPGIIYLYHESLQQLQVDYEAIRSFEERGLYLCIESGE